MRSMALAFILGSILATAVPADGAGAMAPAAAPRAVAADPAAVPSPPAHARHRIRWHSCSATTCRYHYRITWDPVMTATRGYRIYVENFWEKPVSGPACIRTGYTARRLLASIPAGRTSWDGVFTPELHTGGLLINGSRYVIAAVNASGRSAFRVVRPTSSNNGNTVIYQDGYDCV